MRVQLKVAKGASAGKVFKVDGTQFVIGRATGCHLRPQSDAISRQHCAIFLKDDRVLVKDLGSRNGTYVNGTKIKGTQSVSHGDLVSVGPLHLEMLIVHDALLTDSTKVPADTSNVRVDAKHGDTEKIATKKDDSGFISDWLLEDDVAADPDRKTMTREFSLDELPPEASAEEPEEIEKNDTAEVAEKKKKKKKEFGKLPSKQDRAGGADSSRDAAAETLKQLYSRGM